MFQSLGPRLWLGLALLFSALAARGQYSDWQGVWSGDLPGYGTVALRISPQDQKGSPGVELWWLFSDIQLGSGHRFSENSLYVERLDHLRRPAPGLAFQLVSPNELKLVSYGIFDSVIPASWAGLVLRKEASGRAWSNRSDNSKKLNGWRERWKNSDISPITPAWIPEVVMPTAILVSYNDVLFASFLPQVKLPTEYVRTAVAMAQEISTGSRFRTGVYRALAKNPCTDTESLEKIWAHPDDLCSWYLVAAHPNAKPEWRADLVDRIMRGDNRLKQSAAIFAIAGPDELYRRLIADGYVRRCELAGNDSLPAFVYEILAREHANATGQILAKNSKTPPEVLDLLGETKDRERKYDLLANPALREETGRRLGRELSETATIGEYGKLALRRWIPVEVLKKCTVIPDPMIRRLMAESPHMDQEILLILSQDKVRDVARAAREKLQTRFPGSYTATLSTWRPLDSLADSLDGTEQCRLAIEENDINTVRTLLDYLRETMGLERCLNQNAEAVIKEYRPEIMDLFLAAGLANNEFTLTVLAGKSARNPQWLAYFKAHGVLDGKMRGQIFTASLADDNLENLQALIGAGLDVNARDFLFQTALHVAVIKRNQAAVEAILLAGGDLERKDSEGLTPLDRAVRAMFVPAIRRMDKAGRYAGKVEGFVRDFPPSQNGRLLGTWTNRQLNTSPQVSLILYADGTGLFASSMKGEVYVGWRETINNSAEAVLIDRTGEYGRTPALRFSLNPEGTELSLASPKGDSVQLYRNKGAK